MFQVQGKKSTDPGSDLFTRIYNDPLDLRVMFAVKLTALVLCCCSWLNVLFEPKLGRDEKDLWGVNWGVVAFSLIQMLPS